MQYMTKEEQAADFIREGIIAGRFARGSRLKQADIAEMLGLSITPVREALKLLEAEGYVSSSSHKGVTVAGFDTQASTEVLDLRMILEGYLLQRSIERIENKDIETLRRLEADFEDAVQRMDHGAARGANYRFHTALYDVAGAPQALHFVQILWARYPFDLINNLEGRMERAVAEHKELLNYIVRRDLAAALLAVRDHIYAGWNELKLDLGERAGAEPAPEPVLVRG